MFYFGKEGSPLNTSPTSFTGDPAGRNTGPPLVGGTIPSPSVPMAYRSAAPATR